jgi:uroporphyrinogen-III synthase
MKGFAGLRVMSLESRRSSEMAKLITTYGGKPMVAPAMREVPLESNHEAREFAAKLLDGKFDMVILLTGVGTRTLTAIAETVCSREQFLDGLRRVKIAARGPKPLAVLRELGIAPDVAAPEPNTWRELLAALDAAGQADPALRLQGRRVAVQEYGVANPELLKGLAERGATVTQVPVYQWALPDDLGPLREAIRAVTAGEIGVSLFTTAVQAKHMFQVATELNLEEQLRRGLNQTVVASIGPTTSEGLRGCGVTPDLEPSHPKMGFLVKEAAEASAELRERKQKRDAPH